MEFKFGFLHILTLIFVILKLTEVINWSWWLVLLPLCIWLGFWLLSMIIIGVIAIIAIIVQTLD